MVARRVLQALWEIIELPRDGPGTTAGENRDRASVVGARRQSATDSLLDLTGSVLAGEQQHVDHLPRGLRGAIPLGDLLPQLVED